MPFKPLRKRLSNKQRGFTLIELMIVLAIIGLIAGIVGPQAMKYLGKGKTQSAKVQLENISAALDMYRLEVGSYPANEGLKALVTAPANARGWNGPYLKKGEVPKDPWNNDYQYKRPGGNNHPYDLFSYGSDGTAGGEGEDADISVWQQ